MGFYGNRIINVNHAPTGIDCQPVSWRLEADSVNTFKKRLDEWSKDVEL